MLSVRLAFIDVTVLGLVGGAPGGGDIRGVDVTVLGLVGDIRLAF